MKDTVIDIVPLSEIKPKDIVLVPDFEGAELCIGTVRDIDLDGGILKLEGARDPILTDTVVRVTSDNHPIRIQLLKPV